ncbi:MAG: anti-sigma factor family protein, partial [Micromonosporaceae bacterium]
MTCERAHDDAAYLLGALSAADRDSYELHLGECAECRGELAGLAELPALLSRLPTATAERFTAPEAPAEWPADALLERILSAAGERRRAERRRARWRAAAAAVAAACV